MNDQRSKIKIDLNGQGTFLKVPTNKPANTQVLHPDEMKNCRMSRATLVCRFHYREKREREPSRISYRKVIKLFRKARIIRHAARSYLCKCVHLSSSLCCLSIIVIISLSGLPDQSVNYPQESTL